MMTPFSTELSKVDDYILLQCVFQKLLSFGDSLPK